MLRGLEYPINT